MSALPLFKDAPFQARPLRPHQERAIVMLREAMLSGKKRVVLQLPTGAGKTRTAAEIVLSATGKGKRVCFTVPAISLIDQTVEAFEAEGLTDIGVIQSNHPRTNYDAQVQVASVQTLVRRGVPDCELVIVDECHLQHDVIPKWMKRDPGKLFIGLSATPWAKGMADYWQGLVQPVSMQQLIDAGFLSPFRVFAPSHPDLTGVGTVAGDYNQGQLSEVMGDRRLVADVVETWLKRADNRPTLIFAVDLAHARTLQAEFAQAGVAMGYCDAYIDRIERQVLFDQMARGEIAGIVNVGTLTTGVDADVRCVVMARPTKSEMLFVQCIGRGLRTAPGKADCLILDHADNHARLGFVTDIHHPELLAGADKRPVTRKEKGEPMPRECTSCGVLKAPKVRECPLCGFTPTRQSEIEFEEGQLVEVTRGKKTEVTMADKADFHAQLLWIARDRNRSTGWAAHAYKDRFGVWPVKEAKHALPKPPTEAVLNYVRAKDIRFAKRRAKA
jgi:DNA repair protein RadD